MGEPWEYDGVFAELFPVNSKERTEKFTDDELARIAEAFRGHGKKEWGEVVRIYTILRLCGLRETLEKFLDAGMTDYSIPTTYDTLPINLKSSQRTNFTKFQDLVMTDPDSVDSGFGVKKDHLRLNNFKKAKFVTKGLLGRGGCGQVQKVSHSPSGKVYAMKLVQRGKVFKTDLLSVQNFTKELSASKKVKHRHVMSVVGSFTDFNYVGIIMETVATCNLAEFLKGDFDDDKKSLLRQFFGCLASGLDAMHRESIRHKDIKPENILIKDECVMYTDFGIALDYSQVDTSITDGRPAMFTKRYCSPEVDKKQPRRTSSDVFSLALVFVEMVTRLNDETIGDLREFLEAEHRGDGDYYSRCVPGIEKWLKDRIQAKPGPDADKIPLKWILSGPLLEESPVEMATRKALGQIYERPTATEIRNMIIEDTENDDGGEGGEVMVPYPFICSDCSLTATGVHDDESHDEIYDETLESLAYLNTDSSTPSYSLWGSTAASLDNDEEVARQAFPASMGRDAIPRSAMKGSGASQGSPSISVTGPTFHSNHGRVKITQNVAGGDQIIGYEASKGTGGRK